MSRLTEFQIYAMIRTLEASIKRYQGAGNRIAERRSRKRLEEYRAELRTRFNVQLEAQQV